MALFSLAVAYVLANEGVDSNDLGDSGGRTRFGITDAEALSHGLDVTTLTLEQAKSIYYSDYWRFDSLTDQTVATKLMDSCVNEGLGTAVRIMQQVVGVPSDGICGPATMDAINNYSLPFQTLLRKFIRGISLRYCDIVVADKTQTVFLRGWIDRALRLPTQ